VATARAVRGPRGTTTVWVVGDPQGGDEWLGFGRGAWWQRAKEIEWGRCRSPWAFGITEPIGSVPRYLGEFGSSLNRYRSVLRKSRNRANSVSVLSVRFRFLPKEPNKRGKK
jgi:hypothetical protein